MYCGKPVVTTRTVGASEIFEGRAQDLIMGTITKEELIKKMKMVFDPVLYEEVMKINIKTSQKYSADSQNSKLKEVLTSHKIL